MKPPSYRDRLTTGIVHFGPGAFHRAHQADYLHRLAADDPRWGVAAVSMRSAGTIEALRRQGGLYTLAILDERTQLRTIGVHTSFFGPTDSHELRQQFLDPAVRVITSTVTEKGYCLRADGTLDFDHPDIRHDAASPHSPRSLVGWLSLALSIRRRAGLPPPAVICCDNMAANGAKLARAVSDFASRHDRELSKWVDGEVRFPNTMVDSITPASDDRLRGIVSESEGGEDAIPVCREAYAQWVIEDLLPPGGPDLAAAGATLTADVAAWEQAKLRILNAAHSTLAYVGILLGHETVAEAMRNGALRAFVEQLIVEDVIPTLGPSSLDLRDYARQTLQRFRNPAIHHRLAQIAQDGSQKLPYRILDTAAEAMNVGRDLDRIAVPIAAWILFLELQVQSGAEIIDPLADELRELAKRPDSARAILDCRKFFPCELGAQSAFATAVLRLHSAMTDQGPGCRLARLIAAPSQQSA